MPRQTTSERAIAQALKKLQAKEASDQIALLATRMTEIVAQLAVLLERDGQKTETISGLKTQLEALHTEVTEIKDYANRWRGGFYALAGLGGVIGGIVAFWDRLRLWALPITALH